jgi:hypothetical protein
MDIVEKLKTDITALEQYIQQGCLLSKTQQIRLEYIAEQLEVILEEVEKIY